MRVIHVLKRSGLPSQGVGQTGVGFVDNKDFALDLNAEWCDNNTCLVGTRDGDKAEGDVVGHYGPWGARVGRFAATRVR